MKTRTHKLIIPILSLCTFLGVTVRMQAQAVVKVDPSQPWIGYMNVFQLPVNGSGYLFGFVDGTSNLRASFGTTNLTLSPCTNVWETQDTSWVQIDGATPAVVMDANFYVQDDTLANTNVVFIGACRSNSLTAAPEPLTGVSYTSVAFIKIFDANYSIIGSVTTNLVAGHSFTINLNTTGATHVQYGFDTMGPDANPATASALGNVQIPVAGQSANVTVDPSQAWVGYLNVFQLPANGGGYVFGSPWGIADLRAGFPTTNQLVLQPCTNVWETSDTFWVQGNGVTPNKNLDASFYVENNSLANTNVIFSGLCQSSSLAAAPEPQTGITYSSVAFIKIFDGSYNLLNSVSSPGLSAGQPFVISLNTAGAAHVQYGFETIGPDANPSTVAGLGNIILSAAIPASPAPTLTNNASTPTRSQSSVLSLYNSSGVYTNHPVERWLASWSGSGEGTYTIPGTGRTVLKYSNLQYAGVEFYDTANGDNVGGSTDYSIDASHYDTFHVDVWTPNANQFGIQLVSLNPTTGPQVDFLPAGGAITNYGWISLDLPLSNFSAINPGLVLSHLQQMLWIDNQSGGGFTGGTFYIDNVYFYNSAAVNAPTVAASLSSGSLHLSFATLAGSNYTIQYKTNLTDAVWQTLSSVSGNGSTQLVADPANQKSRFYRLYVH